MSKRPKKRKPSKIGTLLRMLGVVKPLTSYMILAVVAGTLAFLAVQFIPILGGYAILIGLGLDVPIPIRTIWILLPVLALLRAILRFAEQRLNHYIAFTLLALVRDKVFGALRKLCPAKLEGKDKGDLVALITSDVELLEVFYAHTISPIPYRPGASGSGRLSVCRHCCSSYYLRDQRQHGRESAQALRGPRLLRSGEYPRSR